MAGIPMYYGIPTSGEVEAGMARDKLDVLKAEEAQKDRETQVTIAEIRAAGMGAMVDINQNQQSDYLDAMANIKKEQNYQEKEHWGNYPKWDSAIASRVEKRNPSGRTT